MTGAERAGILLADTTRSRAYLQYLVRAGLRPAYAILLQDPRGAVLPGQRSTPLSGAHPGDILFDPELPCAQLLRDEAIPTTTLATSDPNNPVVIACVASAPGGLLIYSGPGGAILTAPFFVAGKRVLHVHCGSLPRFRGSTTIYYELLIAGTCAATAMFLVPAIDEGPVVHSRTFQAPNGIDIDYLYDPHCRATVLVETLQRLAAGELPERPQPAWDQPPYYIMHPALRQVVLVKHGIAAETDEWLQVLNWSEN